MPVNLRTLAVCILTVAATPLVCAASVQNYGDPALARVAERAKNQLNVLQIGDSHTAGDLLTGQLRKRLQQQLGDGGSGWVNPMSVAGQQQTHVKYQHSGWQLSSSRNSSENYAMGGLLASPNHAGATLRVSPTQSARQAWRVTATIRQGAQDEPLTVTDADGRVQSLAAPVPNNQWQHVSLSLRPPFVVSAGHSPQTALGGWFMRASPQGATVGAMGINGSQLTHWQRWHNQWTTDVTQYEPDLVILSYGTNEAFNGNLNVNAFSDTLSETVQAIRRHSPNTAIMIVGAPESLRAKSGSCGVRALQLDAVQAAQKQVAQQQKTLFWDWQDSMGGRCSMMSWIQNGNAARDGVHFSASGYRRGADDLYDGLMRVLNNPTATTQPASEFIPVVTDTSRSEPPRTTYLSSESAKINCFQEADGTFVITNRTPSNPPRGKTHDCSTVKAKWTALNTVTQNTAASDTAMQTDLAPSATSSVETLPDMSVPDALEQTINTLPTSNGEQ